MQFVAALPTFDKDQATQLVWQWLQSRLQGTQGVCYYKYPIVGFGAAEIPDLTLLLRGYQPFAIKCADFDLADIRQANGDSWEVKDGDKVRTIDSPFAIADDFKVWLRQRFERERPLRGKLSPEGLVALPLISRGAFVEKFGGPPTINTIWRDGDKLDRFLNDIRCDLSEDEWRMARSVLQAAAPISVAPGPAPSQANTIGKAVRILEKRIALLDEEQQNVALAVPSGP